MCIRIIAGTLVPPNSLWSRQLSGATDMIRTPNHDYTRLDGADSLSSSYEEWQFGRTRWLHHATCGIISTSCLFMRFSTATLPPSQAAATLFVAALGMLMIGIREAAHRLQSSTQRAHYRITYATLVLALLLTTELLDLWGLAATPHSLSLASWFIYYTQTLTTTWLYAVLASAFSINRWVAVLVMGVLTMAYVWVLTVFQFPPSLQSSQAEVVGTMYTLAAIAVVTTAVLYILLENAMRENFRMLKEARAASEVKGRYIAAISHDFGTPCACLHMLFNQLEQHAELLATFQKTLGPTSLDAARAALKLLATIKHKVSAAYAAPPRCPGQ